MWSNEAMHSDSTNTIMNTLHDLKCFGHMVYDSQIARTKILQNVWHNLVDR